MTQPPLPTPANTSGTDFGTVTAAWRTQAATQTQTLSAQSIACCSEVYNVDLVPNPWNYRCAIPVGLEQSLPGTLNIAFPCNRAEIGNFGVLPIPHLNMVPGVAVPGGLINKNVRPPRWVRMQFAGVPRDLGITLYSHTGKRVSEARPLVDGDADSPIRQITFNPDPKLSYALAFTSYGRTEVDDRLSVGINVIYGDGKPPAAALRRARKAKRGKRRTTGTARRAKR